MRQHQQPEYVFRCNKCVKSTVAITTAATPVTSAVPVNIMPQGGVVSSAQQTVTPVVEAMGTITTVTSSGVLVTSQASSMVAFSVLPSVSGTFPSISQSHPVVETLITPLGNTHPVSYPIVIQPSSQRPPSGIIMGVEGLTLPSDPAATVTATVARLVDPMGSHTSLQGLASRQAAIITSQAGMSTTTTIIGTIHGSGLPGPITAAGGSTKPVVSASTSQGEGSQIFMVVEDDDNIVDVGTAQGFTKIVEPKRERADPPLIPPHSSRGQGVGGGVSQGRPPREAGQGCVTIPPTVEFIRDPRDEEEDEIQFDDPEEEDEEGVGAAEDEDDEVQVVTQSGPLPNRSTPSGAIPFNPEIHDITGYEKADIIKL